MKAWIYRHSMDIFTAAGIFIGMMIYAIGIFIYARTENELLGELIPVSLFLVGPALIITTNRTHNVVENYLDNVLNYPDYKAVDAIVKAMRPYCDWDILEDTIVEMYGMDYLEYMRYTFKYMED